MAAQACPLLGNGITDDTLLNIARFLPTANELLCLKLTNSRFAAKVIAAAPRHGVVSAVSAGGGAAAAPEMLCVADEAARLWVAGCSEQERGWVPRRELESWLCLMHEVGLLRVPLVFGRAHADFTVSEDGALATRNGGDQGYRTAASKVVMRSGCHFAQFTTVKAFHEFFGAIRPGWDVEGGANASDVNGHCFYGTYGSGMPGYRDWEGKQSASEAGDRIGMMLDLDQGSMTIWKNEEKLGVIQAEGLRGPLCWAVELDEVAGNSARIESALAPASPTEEELAAAKAWEQAEAEAAAQAEGDDY